MKDVLSLLNKVTEDGFEREEKVLLIDGLNLFFRNFSAINAIAPNGAHIGGLGGFLNSLGRLMVNHRPTQVYVFFDGAESTNRKKRVLPGYKKGRGTHKITNKFIFRSADEEHEAKLVQLRRLIEYLKFLPVKTAIINGIEADDAISYVARELKHKSTIISSDKDFLQIVSDKISVYRPIEKVLYTPSVIKEKYKILPENFIIYKTLLGDKSDNVDGVRGIGPKGVTKLFPELLNEVIDIDGLIEVCSKKMEQNALYSKIILTEAEIKKQHRVMDLMNPMMHQSHEDHLDRIMAEDFPKINEEIVCSFVKKDYIETLIRDVSKWLLNFKK
ncbi:MAG: 5'-3' exonuclease [Methylophagaceae bacterium]|tara:strand:+ start:4412 stop:5401 length:990 start_codon:yes stop_codon:yes gene_type:complete